jgi:hypothetical protein
LEEVKDVSNENAEIELRNLHEYYATKLRIIRDKIEKFENEEVLLKTRVCLITFSYKRNSFYLKL